ncbi:MAG: filamentous hemagglutinin N-terminal domain-containing protein [Oxalobacteraceae bacterium]|nr:filamentous hemagglutinin N-terminal domain-containing protein [Oxalobacteraceae bacterium]
MNINFKTVWNESRQCWIAAPETVRARGKTSSEARRRDRARKTFAALVSGMQLVPSASALGGNLPSNGQLAHGQGDISTNGNTLVIRQTSDKLAIDWESFSIAPGYRVSFVQPTVNSAVLNRVTGSDASTIQGSLQANGHVFLVNPNGILFTRDAQVNVGSLIASTLNITNEDFVGGRYRFSGNSNKSVINQGSLISTGSDGKGGTVALIAARVVNEGAITADHGRVGMAAGTKVLLDMGGPALLHVEQGAVDALIEQGGAIRADGGRILLTAKAANELRTTVINHSGIATARSLSTNEMGEIVLHAGDGGGVVVSGRLDVSSSSAKGGHIQVTGSDIHLTSGATLNASGSTGGGTVLVGGGWQGSGGLPQATTVTMAKGAEIDASAVDQGDGGTVVLWSDIHNAESITAVKGLIKAVAGALSGDGGKVETSGRILDAEGASVLAGTTKGNSGLWLLDPDNLTIDAAGRTSITNALNNGTSVEINTSSAGSFGSTVNFTGATGDVIMRGGDITVSPTRPPAR